MTADRDVRPLGCRCAALATRRQILTVGVGFGMSLAIQDAGAQEDVAGMRPQEGDLLVRADSTDLSPLKPDSLALNDKQTLALPYDPVTKTVRNGSLLNRVLLLRLDPAMLDEQTAPRAVMGIVAYSSGCPHAGCEVINWHADTQVLECPCHNSQFDPKAAASVIGGPAPRGLAALPLRVTSGNLVVAHSFIGKLGIQQA